jgi:hypothetical protein
MFRSRRKVESLLILLLIFLTGVIVYSFHLTFRRQEIPLDRDLLSYRITYLNQIGEERHKIILARNFFEAISDFEAKYPECEVINCQDLKSLLTKSKE